MVSNIAAVSLTVTDVNDAPVAAVDSASVTEDGSVDINVVANDTDLDGTIDPTSVVITTGPSNGTVSVNAVTGVVTYTPNANYFGPDSFSYTVQDDDGQVSNVAAVNLTVSDVNDVLVAVVDSASVAEDGSVDVDVLLNDTDADGMDDGFESDIGSDPLRADTDNDGLMDGLEGFNPGGDADGDGLINVLDPDADDDGLPDGVELILYLSPFNSDSDFDELPDGSEDTSHRDRPRERRPRRERRDRSLLRGRSGRAVGAAQRAP